MELQLRFPVSDQKQAAERKDDLAVRVDGICGLDAFEILGKELLAIGFGWQGLEERPQAGAFVPLDNRFGVRQDMVIIRLPHFHASGMRGNKIVIKGSRVRM